jgi:hypothetical protein
MFTNFEAYPIRMKLSAFIFAICISASAFAQPAYWQQQLRYNIQAELNDTEKSITGFENILYKNNSPDTLNFVWFHIWPNAYKHDSTALMKQIRSDAERAKKEQLFGKGWIEGLSFKVNDSPAQTEAHANPQFIDVIKLLLNTPLLPGDSILISTPFKVFLPPYFSRSGYADGEFMACQWYPKPAVYDQSGWHEMPYLDMGEFYSEYADYQVNLTVPAQYVVGATGTLLTKPEIDHYKSIGWKNVSNRKKRAVLYTPEGGIEKKTLSYFAKNVPDFAWFADPKFVIQYDTIRLPSGKVIGAFSYYHNKKKTIWKNSMDHIKDGVKKYSRWIGDYEYPVVQVVEGPENNSSGGMEYPMITLITSPDAKVESLDAVIAHEIGHNWFMSMLGSNERAHAWMDEGLNTYFQFRYEAEKYRSNSIFGASLPAKFKALPVDQFLAIIYTAIQNNLPMQDAMDKSSEQFANSTDYAYVSYIKTSLWMYILETSVGAEKAERAIQNYFAKWKHKHPQPSDMKQAFEEATGADLTAFFELTKKEGKF